MRKLCKASGVDNLLLDNSGLGELLRVLGSPFMGYSSLYVNLRCFSASLYRFMCVNKVALVYLSKYGDEHSTGLYAYHYSRFKVIVDVLCRVSSILEGCGFEYVVFKTLKPFDEDVADVDVLYLGDGVEGYRRLITALERAGFKLMELSFYCTTLMDPRYKFATEIMVDIYREVSVGPLIYLDKRLLTEHVSLRTFHGCRVRVLEPLGELLITVAHSIIKEREVKLLDYLTALHLVYDMSSREIDEYVMLARKAGLIYASRLFFSIVAYLHRLTYDFVPGKLIELLKALGGAINVADKLYGTLPPYRIRFKDLVRVFREKLCDKMFRSSIVHGLSWFASRRSWFRLLREMLVGL